MFTEIMISCFSTNNSTDNNFLNLRNGVVTDALKFSDTVVPLAINVLSSVRRNMNFLRQPKDVQKFIKWAPGIAKKFTEMKG